MKALDRIDEVNEWTRQTVAEREQLVKGLVGFSFVELIYPSDANFILAKTQDPRGIYEDLVSKGIILRDRSKVELCAGCLRITIGTPDENARLLDALRDYAS